MHRGSFGSHLRPIQHPSGGRGAHSDRNCVRFSTHRGVRTPVFDVPKKMTQKKTRVFSDFGVPKIGTAKIGAMRQQFFRSAEISAKSHQQKTANTCCDGPHAQCCWDFLPRLMPRGHEWCSNGPNEVPVKLTWLPGSVHFILLCRVGCQKCQAKQCREHFQT